MRKTRTKMERINAGRVSVRTASTAVTREVALVGRRNRTAAPNSKMFFTNIEGVEELGRVRGANGIRWKVA